MKLNIREFAKRVDVILMNPRYFFLIFAVLFGLPMLLFRPVYNVPDFGSHFLRAYSISQGDLFPLKVDNTKVFVSQGGITKDNKSYTQVGGVVPRDAAVLSQAVFSLDEGGKDPNLISAKNQFGLYDKIRDYSPTQVQYNTTAVYVPFSYLPQAFALGLGNLLGLSLFWGVFLASLVNFLLWLYLVQKSIMTTPVGKWVMVVLALLPMTLFLAPSLSPDGLLMGVIFMFFAYLMKAIKSAKKLDMKDIIPLVILSFVLAGMKQTYFVLVFATLVLFHKFRTRREAILAITACVIPALLLVLIWSLFIKHLNFTIAPWSEPTHQLHYLLSQPLSFIKQSINTVLYNFDWVLWSFFGVLGWLTTPIPLLAVGMLVGSMFIAFSVDDNKIMPSKYQKSILALTLLSTSALIVMTLYVYWTAPGSKIIDGIQGRYFIPLVVFVVPLVMGYRLKESSKKRAIYTMQALIIVSLIMTAVTLTKMYYPGIV